MTKPLPFKLLLPKLLYNMESNFGNSNLRENNLYCRHSKKIGGGKINNSEIIAFLEDVDPMEIPINKGLLPMSVPPIRGRFIAEPPIIQTGILLGSNRTL